MKVVFICMGTVNIGIESLSAVLEKNGYEAELVYDPALFDDKRYFHSPVLAKKFNQESRVVQQAVNAKPDFITFSTITDNFIWACRLAEKIKKKLPEIPIILGGPHPTLLPEKVIQKEFVDFVVVGEAEYALLDLLNALKDKKDYSRINNVWLKKNNEIISNPVRPLISNLDELPFPNKELFNKYIPYKDEYIIISGRGCPYICTFCCNHVWKNIYKDKGQYLRKRSVQNVIDELKINKEKYNFKSIYFADEVFTWDKKWIKEFSQFYPKEIGLPFKCVCHPLQMDEDTIKYLKRSGCYAIQIGVQSTDEDIKKNILRRPEKNQEVKEAVERCHRNNIIIIVDHIFGLPGEKEEDLHNAALFYSEIKPKRITNYSLTYFPRTDIISYAKDIGAIDENRIKKIEEGKEDSYISGGSIKDKKYLSTIKCFTVFFTIIPFLSNKLNRKIAEKKIYKKFNLIPDILVILFDFMTVIFITHEYRGINYIKYYYRELKHFFVGHR